MLKAQIILYLLSNGQVANREVDETDGDVNTDHGFAVNCNSRFDGAGRFGRFGRLGRLVLRLILSGLLRILFRILLNILLAVTTSLVLPQQEGLE